MPEHEKIEQLTDSLKKYVNTNYELIKLEAAERTSIIGSGFISGLIVGLVGILFIFFLSLGAGFYLSSLIGNNYTGFSIIAGFYLILGIILIIGRKKMIEIPARDRFIKKVFYNN